MDHPQVHTMTIFMRSWRNPGLDPDNDATQRDRMWLKPAFGHVRGGTKHMSSEEDAARIAAGQCIGSVCCSTPFELWLGLRRKGQQQFSGT